ncbi:copper amine oxidase N-terminal domain-containing protein [Alkalicoccus urumqiensis]|uniref:copper amine oxidase N-terminal domain-containing protein n=1 Tax=Alkalicoccus urumqiensis TaxID=1548213 RepID=UPI0015E61FE9|nr:copper amine oxidase N-terminal domain-containing protein [Alkalicoccus urumqiensis]
MNHFWKSTAAGLTAFFIAGTITSASTPAVTMNDDVLSFDQQPFIEQGRTFVPMRAIYEAFGAEVRWDQDSQTVTALKDGERLRMTISEPEASVNGETVYLDAPPQLTEKNRTMVPLRFISETFGAEVRWDAEAGIARLYEEDIPSPDADSLEEKGRMIQEITAEAVFLEEPFDQAAQELSPYATSSYIDQEAAAFYEDETFCYSCDQQYFPFNIADGILYEKESSGENGVFIRTYSAPSELHRSAVYDYELIREDGEWKVDSFEPDYEAELTKTLSMEEALYTVKDSYSKTQDNLQVYYRGQEERESQVTGETTTHYQFAVYSEALQQPVWVDAATGAFDYR